MLELVASDDLCAPALAHIVTDIINGDVSPSIRSRLTRCRLVALPKPDGGVRPIAVGDALLKVAARVLFATHRRQLLRHFGDLQFGCLREGGAEIVAHTLRKDLSQGMNAVTLDMKNAFNSVARSSISSELYETPALRPFIPLFLLEYLHPSDLLFYQGGALRDTVESTHGTRQGSTLGGLFFCAALHPVLTQLRQLFPTVNVYAYMDDITMTCADPEVLAEAILVARRLFAAISLEFNPAKCEWFGPAPRPLSLSDTLGANPPVLKVLGAYFGPDHLVDERILQKLEKHIVLFTRLRALDPSTATMAMLQRCGLPRFNFISRTHAPAITLRHAEAFDAAMFGTFTSWTSTTLTAELRAMVSLPVSLGGAGLTSQALIAPIAYAASLSFAQNALGLLVGPAAPDQKTASLVAHTEARGRLEVSSPGLKRHLEECSAKGAAAWMTASKVSFRGPAFAAAMRYRLRAPPENSAPILSCPGCSIVYPTHLYDSHTAGCVKIRGPNATVKHNAIVKILHDLCAQANVPATLEPRDLEAFVCHACGETILFAAKHDHALRCKASFSRTGPDLRIFWDAGSTVYDVTIAHVTAPSYAATSPEQIVANKIRAKEALYLPLLGDEPFVVLPARAHGTIEPALRTLVKRLATLAEIPTALALDRISVALARFVGLSIVEGRRAVLRRP